ncbi:hypothetical protein SAMN06265337_1807 [Hymenobacter gelipurpurascens]|uniref:Uncharacterized protein n=1 Tax=Hymenobacter gelipurpurascens TaxID=89968 RepID=A0A212TME3_9BACT|nr:hypothetical protein SAMN06265337_1807 [Hymenobacter gelipurpurascens]
MPLFVGQKHHIPDKRILLQAYRMFSLDEALTQYAFAGLQAAALFSFLKSFSPV